MQQPVCIVLAARWTAGAKEQLAEVLWRSLPAGHRQGKFEALGKLAIADSEWELCPSEGRAPFLPASAHTWAGHPALEDFFLYDGAGVMPGRTWVIAPDAKSLERRWAKLVSAPAAEKERLFHPHLRNGKPGDKHSNKIVSTPLAGFPVNERSVASESGSGLQPARYGYRSFDRQWIIPDARVINQPNPHLWGIRSERQTFITAFAAYAPTNGPALTVAALVPNHDHYRGSFAGRVFPLWADSKSTQPNVRPALLAHLGAAYGKTVGAQDLFAYIVAIAAHPAYIERFRGDLATPGLRIPLTADLEMFEQVIDVGRRVVWLHSFGERMADAKRDRPPGPPRLPANRRPQVPAKGAIPSDPAGMPDRIEHDDTKQRLLVGAGWVEPVPAAVWRYEVSGKQVLTQWFSYRRKTRQRPIIGDRRPPSPLGDIQPDTWPAEYTSELLNVLNVLGLLVDLEPLQAELLDKVCAGPLITTEALRAANVLTELATSKTKSSAHAAQTSLFTD